MSHAWDEMQRCRAVGIIWDFEAAENHLCFTPHLLFRSRMAQGNRAGLLPGPDVMSPEREAENGKRMGDFSLTFLIFSNILVFLNGDF